MKLGLLVIIAGIAASAQPSFDTSANGRLTGAYFVRELLLNEIDQTTGAVGRAQSLTGIMTFNGAGSYSFTGQIMDSNTGQSAAINGQTGQYGVSASGLAYLQDVIDTTQYNFGEIGATGSAGASGRATYSAQASASAYVASRPSGPGLIPS